MPYEGLYVYVHFELEVPSSGALCFYSNEIIVYGKMSKWEEIIIF